VIDWLNDNAGAVQAASAVVLAATFIAVAYYACQTRKLVKEAREQRLVTTRPILLLSPLALERGRWDDDIADQILRLALRGPLTDTTPVRVINIGQGVAVGIRVAYKPPEQDPRERVIDYLVSGSDDVERNFRLAPKEGLGNRRTLQITYYDIFGNKYESRREFHKDPDSNRYVFTPLVQREVIGRQK